LEETDKEWMGSLTKDNGFKKIYFKYINTKTKNVYAAAVASIPHPFFCTIDGIFAKDSQAFTEFVMRLIECYKKEVTQYLPFAHINTVDPRLSIKHMTGYDAVLINKGFKLGQGIFTEEKDWFVFSLRDNLLHNNS